jgi:hypothetical protein
VFEARPIFPGDFAAFGAVFEKIPLEQGDGIGTKAGRLGDDAGSVFFLPSEARPDIRCGRFRANPRLAAVSRVDASKRD